MHWTITVLLCLQNSLKSQCEKWKGQIKSEKVKSKMWKVKVENWKFIDKSVHWWEESERGNIGQSLISITLLSDDYFITGLGSETLTMFSLICRICRDGATKGEILLLFNIFLNFTNMRLMYKMLKKRVASLTWTVAIFGVCQNRFGWSSYTTLLLHLLWYKLYWSFGVLDWSLPKRARQTL